MEIEVFLQLKNHQHIPVFKLTGENGDAMKKNSRGDQKDAIFSKHGLPTAPL